MDGRLCPNSKEAVGHRQNILQHLVSPHVDTINPQAYPNTTLQSSSPSPLPPQLPRSISTIESTCPTILGNTSISLHVETPATANDATSAHSNLTTVSSLSPSLHPLSLTNTIPQFAITAVTTTTAASTAAIAAVAVSIATETSSASTANTTTSCVAPLPCVGEINDIVLAPSKLSFPPLSHPSHQHNTHYKTSHSSGTPLAASSPYVISASLTVASPAISDTIVSHSSSALHHSGLGGGSGGVRSRSTSRNSVHEPKDKRILGSKNISDVGKMDIEMSGTTNSHNGSSSESARSTCESKKPTADSIPDAALPICASVSTPPLDLAKSSNSGNGNTRKHGDDGINNSTESSNQDPLSNDGGNCSGGCDEVSASPYNIDSAIPIITSICLTATATPVTDTSTNTNFAITDAVTPDHASRISAKQQPQITAASINIGDQDPKPKSSRSIASTAHQLYQRKRAATQQPLSPKRFIPVSRHRSQDPPRPEDNTRADVKAQAQDSGITPKISDIFQSNAVQALLDGIQRIEQYCEGLIQTQSRHSIQIESLEYAVRQFTQGGSWSADPHKHTGPPHPYYQSHLTLPQPLQEWQNEKPAGNNAVSHVAGIETSRTQDTTFVEGDENKGPYSNEPPPGHLEYSGKSTFEQTQIQTQTQPLPFQPPLSSTQYPFVSGVYSPAGGQVPAANMDLINRDADLSRAHMQQSESNSHVQPTSRPQTVLGQSMSPQIQTRNIGDKSITHDRYSYPQYTTSAISSDATSTQQSAISYQIPGSSRRHRQLQQQQQQQHYSTEHNTHTSPSATSQLSFGGGVPAAPLRQLQKQQSQHYSLPPPQMHMQPQQQQEYLVDNKEYGPGWTRYGPAYGQQEETLPQGAGSEWLPQQTPATSTPYSQSGLPMTSIVSGERDVSLKPPYLISQQLMATTQQQRHQSGPGYTAAVPHASDVYYNQQDTLTARANKRPRISEFEGISGSSQVSYSQLPSIQEAVQRGIIDTGNLGNIRISEGSSHGAAPHHQQYAQQRQQQQVATRIVKGKGVLGGDSGGSGGTSTGGYSGLGEYSNHSTPNTGQARSARMTPVVSGVGGYVSGMQTTGNPDAQPNSAWLSTQRQYKVGLLHLLTLESFYPSDVAMLNVFRTQGDFTSDQIEAHSAALLSWARGWLRYNRNAVLRTTLENKSKASLNQLAESLQHDLHAETDFTESGNIRRIALLRLIYYQWQAVNKLGTKSQSLYRDYETKLREIEALPNVEEQENEWGAILKEEQARRLVLIREARGSVAGISDPSPDASIPPGTSPATRTILKSESNFSNRQRHRKSSTGVHTILPYRPQSNVIQNAEPSGQVTSSRYMVDTLIGTPRPNMQLQPPKPSHSNPTYQASSHHHFQQLKYSQSRQYYDSREKRSHDPNYRIESQQTQSGRDDGSEMSVNLSPEPQ